jgi:hypothetical protein
LMPCVAAVAWVEAPPPPPPLLLLLSSLLPQATANSAIARTTAIANVFRQTIERILLLLQVGTGATVSLACRFFH